MDMKKSFSYSSITIILLVVVVLIMSVGYAGFSRELKINGNATVGASSWNVKFLKDTYSESPSSVTVAEDDLTISETSMSYKITLAEPGDFYEFTINAENAGTFDAVLKSITLSELSEDEKKYLTYELSYKGTTYKQTAADLNIDMLSGDTVPVKVTVRYFQPDVATDLPSTEQTIALTATLNFAQKTA